LPRWLRIPEIGIERDGGGHARVGGRRSSRTSVHLAGSPVFGRGALHLGGDSARASSSRRAVSDARARPLSSAWLRSLGLGMARGNSQLGGAAVLLVAHPAVRLFWSSRPAGDSSGGGGPTVCAPPRDDSLCLSLRRAPGRSERRAVGNSRGWPLRAHSGLCRSNLGRVFFRRADRHFARAVGPTRRANPQRFRRGPLRPGALSGHKFTGIMVRHQSAWAIGCGQLATGPGMGNWPCLYERSGIGIHPDPRKSTCQEVCRRSRD